MSIIFSFLAGLGSVLSFGNARREQYPFAYWYKAINSDWRKVGDDMYSGLKKHKGDNNEA